MIGRISVGKSLILSGATAQYTIIALSILANLANYSHFLSFNYKNFDKKLDEIERQHRGREAK